MWDLPFNWFSLEILPPTTTTIHIVSYRKWFYRLQSLQLSSSFSFCLAIVKKYPMSPFYISPTLLISPLWRLFQWSRGFTYMTDREMGYYQYKLSRVFFFFKEFLDFLLILLYFLFPLLLNRLSICMTKKKLFYLFLPFQ